MRESRGGRPRAPGRCFTLLPAAPRLCRSAGAGDSSTQTGTATLLLLSDHRATYGSICNPARPGMGSGSRPDSRWRVHLHGGAGSPRSEARRQVHGPIQGDREADPGGYERVRCTRPQVRVDVLEGRQRQSLNRFQPFGNEPTQAAVRPMVPGRGAGGRAGAHPRRKARNDDGGAVAGRGLHLTAVRTTQTTPGRRGAV